MGSQVLKRIRTTQEAERLSEEIDILLASCFENKGEGFDIALRNKIRAWVSSALVDEFSNTGINKVEYLKKLREEIKTYKILRLTLAFEPSEALLDRIYSHVVSNFGIKKIFLEINYAPDLIGGAVVAYEGRYSDFSIRRVFEEEFGKMRKEIVNLLKHTGQTGQ